MPMGMDLCGSFTSSPVEDKLSCKNRCPFSVPYSPTGRGTEAFYQAPLGLLGTRVTGSVSCPFPVQPYTSSLWEESLPQPHSVERRVPSASLPVVAMQSNPTKA